MTHHFTVAIHFDFHTRKFEVAEVIVCRDCKKVYPLPFGTLAETDEYSAARASPEGDWNAHQLYFDVGRFLYLNKAFHDLLHEECPVFDEAEVMSSRGHGL